MNLGNVLAQKSNFIQTKEIDIIYYLDFKRERKF